MSSDSELQPLVTRNQAAQNLELHENIMSLRVLDTDDEVTKELKETVINIFVAAGVLGTGFTKDSMAKYMLGMAQAGKLPGGPIDHLSEDEAIVFCHAQCDEMFQTLDGNSDGTVTMSEAFDFVAVQDQEFQLLSGPRKLALARVRHGLVVGV